MKDAPILDAKLDEEHTVTFTTRDLIVIFNILIGGSYKLGDAVLVKSIVDKLQPLVAVDTNVKEVITEDKNGSN